MVLLEVIASLLWACLSGAPDVSHFNPVFSILISSIEIAEEYMQNAALTFAPGLLDAVESATPPSLAFFKSLPLFTGFCWAVYAIVFEKPGYPPKVYVGKSTNHHGANTRMRDYDLKMRLPWYIKAAFDEGYVITHKGFLCYKRNPTPSQYAIVEPVILALEATFAFFFWAMRARTKDYAMSHARGWDLDAFQYEGLCSHSPLGEGLSWCDLTTEQAEAVAAERRQAKRASDTRKLAKAKATKKFNCKTCKRAFNTRNQKDRHDGTPYHKSRLDGVRIAKTPQAKSMAKSVNLKRFPCHLCEYYAPNDNKLQRHLDTDKHKFKVIAAKKAAESSS